MEDDDPFSFITLKCCIPPYQEKLLDQLPFTRRHEVHIPFRSRAITVPSYLPLPHPAAQAAYVESLKAGENQNPQIPTPIEEIFANRQARASPSTAAAAVNVAHAKSIRIGENRTPQIPTPIGEPFPSKQVRAPPSTTSAAVHVAHARSLRIGENRNPQTRTQIEEPFPNKQVRVSTREVGECSKKRRSEIPKDVEIIKIEDSDDEGEEEMQEGVETAENAGAQGRRLLPSWARVNQKVQDFMNAQKSKQREGDEISAKQREDDKISTKKRREDEKITLFALLDVLAREQVEFRRKHGLDDGTTGDFLETAIRRGVKFGGSK